MTYWDVRTKNVEDAARMKVSFPLPYTSILSRPRLLAGVLTNEQETDIFGELGVER